jgi:hypothetical protein
MLTARGEFPEAAQEAPAVQGSFDFGASSLREAAPSLRMTELVAHFFSSVAGGCASPAGTLCPAVELPHSSQKTATRRAGAGTAGSSPVFQPGSE